jgi:hypothetical protein
MRLRWAGRNPCTAGEREGVRAEALCRVPFSFGQAKAKKEGIRDVNRVWTPQFAQRANLEVQIQN